MDSIYIVFYNFVDSDIETQNGLSILHFSKVILRHCEVRATCLNCEQLAIILCYSQLYSLINLNLIVFLTLPSQLVYLKEFQAKTNPWFLKIKLFFWPLKRKNFLCTLLSDFSFPDSILTPFQWLRETEQYLPTVNRMSGHYLCPCYLWALLHCPSVQKIQAPSSFLTPSLLPLCWGPLHRIYITFFPAI